MAADQLFCVVMEGGVAVYGVCRVGLSLSIKMVGDQWEGRFREGIWGEGQSLPQPLYTPAPACTLSVPCVHSCGYRATPCLNLVHKIRLIFIGIILHWSQ